MKQVYPQAGQLWKHKGDKIEDAFFITAVDETSRGYEYRCLFFDADYECHGSVEGLIRFCELISG